MPSQDTYKHPKDDSNKVFAHVLYVIRSQKVPQQLRSEAELDTFLLFYKVLVGFRPSELSGGHRVFIKLQVFPVYRTPERPVMEEAVVIMLLIHQF